MIFILLCVSQDKELELRADKQHYINTVKASVTLLCFNLLDWANEKDFAFLSHHPQNAALKGLFTNINLMNYKTSNNCTKCLDTPWAVNALY